jgi:PHD/YefM family antitoxin component YafN of YafNO toxin-antitoxin module
MLTEDLSILEDATAEAVSTLEALDDIAGTVEAIVIGLGGAQERDAYLALADEYDAFADTLADEPELRTPEQSARLSEFEKLLEDAFLAILKGCPEHIRKLHDATRAAIAAEEALVE